MSIFWAQKLTYVLTKGIYTELDLNPEKDKIIVSWPFFKIIGIGATEPLWSQL